MHAGGESVSLYSLLLSLCRRALFGSAVGVLAVCWLAGCGRAAADTSGLSALSGNYASQAWAMRWWIPISGAIALGVAVLAGVMLVRRFRSGRDDSPPTGTGEQLALPPGQSEGSPKSDGSAESDGAPQPGLPSASPAPSHPDAPQEPERIPVRGPAKAAPVMDLRNQFARAKATSRALTGAAERSEDIYKAFGRNCASGTIKDLVVGLDAVGLDAVVGLRPWPAGEEAAWERVVATGWLGSFHEAAVNTIGSAVEPAK